MSAFAIDIHQTVTAALARLKEGLAPAQVNAATGPAGAELFQRHFRKLPPNKKHFPTTSFWPRAAAATTWSPAAEGVTIRVDQEGVLYQWRGGRVEPSKTYLTIPAIAEAYGHRAADFDLEFAIVNDHGFHRPALVAPRDPIALVAAARGEKPPAAGASAEPVVYFWLVRSAHKEPSAEVVPADDEITAAAASAVASNIAARWQPEGGQ